MKRLIPILALLGLFAWASPGELIQETVTLTLGANLYATNTCTVSGYLDTIIIDVPAGSVTGDVDIVWGSTVTTVADLTIYTNNLVATDTTIRPRVDGNAIATGAALTSDDPWRLALPDNGTLTCSVTNASATNLVFKVIVITEKQ